jgi:hypothetical protein
MGTRNLTCVVKNGEIVVAQYGQWDGSPEGQGSTCCDFIQNADLEKFSQNLDGLEELTEETISQRYRACGSDGSGWVDMGVAKSWPWLSRDCGAGILNYILEGQCKEVVLSTSFAVNSLFCEFAYVLDMDREVLEFYTGFQQESHNKGRFAEMEREDSSRKYYPVRLTLEIPFSEIKERGAEALLELTREEEEV